MSPREVQPSQVCANEMKNQPREETFSTRELEKSTSNVSYANCLQDPQQAFAWLSSNKPSDIRRIHDSLAESILMPHGFEISSVIGKRKTKWK